MQTILKDSAFNSLQDRICLQNSLGGGSKPILSHPSKCHSMRVTRHQHHKQILFDYSLHNQTLENVQSAKYLVPSLIIWNLGQHISEISSKATKTLGFLRRNLAFAPRSTKEVAYKTLVGLNYSMQHPFGALTQNFRLIR